VEFGISAGFIHVIDDEQEFPRTFGADVVAGVLEIPGEIIARLKRKPAQEVVDVWSVLRVYSYSHALGRRKPLWTCSVQHSMNLTGPNRFDLDVNKMHLHCLDILLRRVWCSKCNCDCVQLAGSRLKLHHVKHRKAMTRMTKVTHMHPNVLETNPLIIT